MFDSTSDPFTGEIKNKARLAVQGFSQIFGVNYFNTYAPTLSINMCRLIFAIGLLRGMKFKQFDVRTAFLNSKLLELIFVKSIQGMPTPPGKIKVMRKAVYGLK